MCGIAGLLFPERGLDEAAARLEKMRRSLHHRGPDDSGRFVSPRVLLAHTRLALVDIEGGHQPMSDASGRYQLVFNGEVYNHSELRRELEDYPFQTSSDTETLLAALIRWGPSCLPKLDGMFAFAFWDAERGEALLARDALGVKPLVFGRRGQELVFASEAKAILASGWQRRLCEQALVEYIVAPAFSGVRHSMFEGLEHLPAGHLLRVDRNGAAAPEAWFDYHIAPSSNDDPRELASELRQTLRKSVRLSLRADVEVGLFLSGGLDSSLLGYLASEKGDAPMAFSLRFQAPESIDYVGSSIVISDDAPFVDRVAADLCMELVHADVLQDAILRDLPRLAATNDRIVAWEQEIGQDALARAAAGHRKAVLVGDAADETHFGYFFLLREEVTRSPQSLIERFGASARLATLAPRLRREQPLERIDVAYREIARALGASFSGPIDERRRAATALIVKLWLGRLLHNGDIHTMAHSVEARVPFASAELLRFVAKVTPELGFANSVEKSLLRSAATGILPHEIATRKKSALPVDPRLGSRYQKALLQLLGEEADLAHSLLDLDEVQRLCTTPVTGDTHRSQLFTLINLLLWKRAHLD